MSRSNKNSVGRAIAKTRAGLSNVSNHGEGGVYSTKSGGYKNGSNRFEPSKSDTGVRDHIRNKKNKDGCFITTAACEYQGLPDDCQELIAMRRFRDEHLLSTEEGRRLVESYYEMAPHILEVLDKERDLPFVWGAVQECVSLIAAGQAAHAIATYKNMVLALQNRIGCQQG